MSGSDSPSASQESWSEESGGEGGQKGKELGEGVYPSVPASYSAVRH